MNFKDLFNNFKFSKIFNKIRNRSVFSVERLRFRRNPYRSIYKSNRRKINWSKTRSWAIKILLAGIFVILVVFAWFAKDLPTPGKIKHRQSAAATQIFDRNGNQLYAVHGDVKRIMIESKDIPEVAKQATITAEDRNFYKHHGINLRGILRAVYYNITHKSLSQGGSTITQQYVKNALLYRNKTFTRKIKELILSIEIEIMYSKDEILTMYLNEIPYGSNNYGIEAASESYLGKKANELTLAEAATLAALPQSPTYYSPYGIHPDKRLIRTDWILNSMVDQKYITKEEAEKAKEEAKNIKFIERKENIQAPHFVMYIKDLLVDKYGEAAVEEGGLKVTTTLDADKQKAAEEAIANANLSGINASNAALVSLDPKTGQILAMVGSRDFFNQDIDGQVNVAIAERQPGSAFKPVVYATAFKKQYSPGYTLWDVTTDFGDYVPKNYNGNNNGPVTVRKALAGSLNIPAVKMLYLAGMDNVLDQAHAMGITTLNDKNRYGLSLVLGGGEIKLLDLATAYGVFANKGTLAQTTAIMKVTDADGKVLEEYKENKKDVLDPAISYEISHILADNDARSYVFGSNSALSLGDRPAAAKTGTTSLYKDAWTLGYTPSLVAGVWVGNNNGASMSAGAAGAMAAAPIWHNYMEKALANSPVEGFERPAGITDGSIDRFSNKLPSGGETVNDIFTSWQIPKDRSENVGMVRVDKFTGKRATDDCPVQYVDEKQFMEIHSEQPDNPNWENPVQAYIKDVMGIYTTAAPGDERTCAGTQKRTTVSISSPGDGDNVSGNFNIKMNINSTVGIKSVSVLVDNIQIASPTSAPYTVTYNASSLSSGKHTISVNLIDQLNIQASDSVQVTKEDSKLEVPGNVSGVSINSSKTSVSISWKNPSSKGIDSNKVYLSSIKGSIGDTKKVISTGPNQTESTSINGLASGQTYYITITVINSNGEETLNPNQYQFTTP